MRRRRRFAWVLAIVPLVATGATAASAFAPGESRADGRVLGPGRVTVTLRVEHSRFDPPRIVVHQHTPVTFRVVNHDPIGHELIVGDDEVHARHESGTHSEHGAVPGEVSVAPGETATTTYRFHTPGTVLFACHLRGHLAYGMVGEVIVEPAADHQP